MKNQQYRLHWLCSLLWILIVSACSPSQTPERPDVASNPDLAAHSAEFKQGVIKVVDGVYVAVGFGLANSVLLEVEKKLHIGMMKIKDKDLVHNVTLAGIFDGMAVKLDPVKSADVNVVAGFRFPDAGQAYTVHVRRGVAEIQPVFPANPDISLTVDSNVWKEVVTGFRNPAVALVKDVDKEGGILEIIKFLSLFKSEE